MGTARGRGAEERNFYKQITFVMVSGKLVVVKPAFNGVHHLLSSPFSICGALIHFPCLPTILPSMELIQGAPSSRPLQR